MWKWSVQYQLSNFGLLSQEMLISEWWCTSIDVRCCVVPGLTEVHSFEPSLPLIYWMRRYSQPSSQIGLSNQSARLFLSGSGSYAVLEGFTLGLACYDITHIITPPWALIRMYPGTFGNTSSFNNTRGPYRLLTRLALVCLHLLLLNITATGETPIPIYDVIVYQFQPDDDPHTW